MNTFLAILLLVAMIGTVVALVRGIIIFLRTTEADLKGTGPSDASKRSNKMMQQRVLWQAGAVVILAIILMVGAVR